jgi:chromosome segregation ATPase
MGLLNTLNAALIFNWPHLRRRGVELLGHLGDRLQAPGAADFALPKRDGASTRRSPAKPPEHSDIMGDPKPAVDTADIKTQLLRGAINLEAICKDTEKDFLRLGSQLHTIHGDAQQLTQRVVAILAADQQQTIQGALKTIQTHATGALEDLHRCHARLNADLTDLKGIQNELHSLLDENQGFKKVAKNLKMVGLCISIESSRSQKAKATFQALAEEIVQLARTVHTVAGDIGEDTGIAQASLEAIQSQARLRSHYTDDLMASTQGAVADALDQVERLLQLTVAALDDIGVKARDIGEQVAQLVVGVQIHDNITQRAAHINTSLHESAAMLAARTGADATASQSEQDLGKAYALIRLQTTQLHTIVEDVAAVRHQSETALDKLLAAVAAVARPEGFDSTGNGTQCGFDTADSHHPVAVLRKALMHLLTLLDDGLRDIRQLNGARENTGRTITRLGQHMAKVQDINQDIRLKSWNAVIKSNRLGETGKVIEVIVNEMKELAEESNGTIEAVTTILEKIDTASDILDQKNRTTQAEADTAGQELRKGIEAFTAACSSFKEQSHDAFQMGLQLQEKVAKSRKELAFLQKLEAKCREQCAGLTEMAARLQPYADAAPGDWMERDEAIRQRYTMQREREIHHNVYSAVKPPGDQAPAISTAHPPDDSDDPPLDDNIELF